MQEHTTRSAAFVFVCRDSEIPRDGSIITRSLGGQSVALARRSPGEDVLVAFETRCPHMQAPLKFGRVVDGEVVCPWHFFRFDSETGAPVACTESMMRLATYPVERRAGEIFVRLA